MKNKLFSLLIYSSFLFLIACQKTSVNPEADLSLEQTLSSESPIIGANVTITVTVLNNGPEGATGVTVIDNIPTGYSLVSAVPSTGNWTGGTWIVGSLASGSSASIILTAKVNDAGSYTNSASVSATQTDPTAGNNIAASSTVPVLPVVMKVTYMADVKPILVASCTPCHMTGGSQPKKWDVYATVKSNINVILDRVNRAQGSQGFMPNGGTKLLADKIVILNQWVTDGLLEN